MLGIIPAAGYGTRLFELGKEYPKCILPYRERPLLVWNVEWLRAQGCTDIRIVVSHQEEKIREVADLYGLDVTITNPTTMGGLSQSVFSAIEVLPANGPVLIVLGDILVESDKLDYSNDWLSTFEVEDWSRWCMVDPLSRVFYDKPTPQPPTNEALSGVYFFQDCSNLANSLKSQIEEGVKIGGELQISTAITRMGSQFETRKLTVKDFGTLANYLENRGLRNSRSFNEVKLSKFAVCKSSQQRTKIIAERSWYQNIPADLAVCSPRVLHDNLFAPEGSSYTMERLYLPTLRELYLFFDRSVETWSRILSSCVEVYQTFGKYRCSDCYADAILEKTEKRRRQWLPGENATSRQFMERFERQVRLFERDSQLIHGDFCFSNLFWNDANNSIKMVDPRGDMYGSRYYDWSKLRHSAIYNYDFIDAELYTVHRDNVRLFDGGTNQVGELFREIERGLFSFEEIEYIELLTASLFLSMIPLHSHSTVNQRMYYEKFLSIVGE